MFFMMWQAMECKDLFFCSLAKKKKQKNKPPKKLRNLDEFFGTTEEIVPEQQD